MVFAEECEKRICKAVRQTVASDWLADAYAAFKTCNSKETIAAAKIAVLVAREQLQQIGALGVDGSSSGDWCC